jgi:hypothetical protein
VFLARRVDFPQFARCDLIVHEHHARQPVARKLADALYGVPHSTSVRHWQNYLYCGAIPAGPVWLHFEIGAILVGAVQLSFDEESDGAKT